MHRATLHAAGLIQAKPADGLGGEHIAFAPGSANQPIESLTFAGLELRSAETNESMNGESMNGGLRTTL